MTKKKLTILLLPMILCLLGCGFIYLFLNCNYGAHPIQNLQSLLLSERDYPGWKTTYILPVGDEDDMGKESIMIHLSPESGLGSSSQYVYRFNNIFLAMDGYDYLKNNLTLLKENKSNFLVYESRVADQWFMACEDSTSTPNILVCDTLSRYQDFVVFFTISLDKTQFTSEQLQTILEAIDQKMETHLQP